MSHGKLTTEPHITIFDNYPIATRPLPDNPVFGSYIQDMKNVTSYRITGAQETYLRRLLIEAFSHLYSDRAIPYDHHHLSRVTKTEASQAIEHLTAAKARGWTKLAPSAESIVAEETRSQTVAVRVAKIRELRTQGFKCNCADQKLEHDHADETKCDLHSRM